MCRPVERAAVSGMITFSEGVVFTAQYHLAPLPSICVTCGYDGDKCSCSAPRHLTLTQEEYERVPHSQGWYTRRPRALRLFDEAFPARLWAWEIQFRTRALLWPSGESEWSTYLRFFKTQRAAEKCLQNILRRVVYPKVFRVVAVLLDQEIHWGRKTRTRAIRRVRAVCVPGELSLDSSVTTSLITTLAHIW